MSTGLKANSDGSAAIQVGGTDVITLTSGGAATFVTSPTTVQAGTAAAPSITFSGDTNTGIYSPGADTVGLTAGGTLVGSVGLGTTLALQGATSQSGTGITFPVAVNASSNANTLDDYEEGTWTPTIASSSGTITTYTSSGNYIKIGRQVTAQAVITISNVGTASGFANIGGLPFTVLSGITAVPFIVAEYDITGNSFRGYLTSNNTTGQITTLTNGNLTWVNNYKYIFTVTYLSA